MKQQEWLMSKETMMIPFLDGIGAKIGGYIALALGSLVALVTVFNKIKNSGRKEVRDKVNAETKDKIIEVMKDDKEIEETNRAMPADARRDRLREYASDNNDK
jgi:uncharacterized ion transporter superfamily protein YfcC